VRGSAGFYSGVCAVGYFLCALSTRVQMPGWRICGIFEPDLLVERFCDQLQPVTHFWVQQIYKTIDAVSRDSLVNQTMPRVFSSRTYLLNISLLVWNKSHRSSRVPIESAKHELDVCSSDMAHMQQQAKLQRVKNNSCLYRTTARRWNSP